MKKLINSLLAVAFIAGIQPALADTVEIKAYSAPSGEVLLLPSTTTTTFKVLNSGAVVHAGDTITLTEGKTFVLPSNVTPGMLLSTSGAVIGTDAVLMDNGRVKIKTTEGKTIIKYDD